MMIVTEISPAMRPYSMAVAPLRSPEKLEKLEVKLFIDAVRVSASEGAGE